MSPSVSGASASSPKVREGGVKRVKSKATLVSNNTSDPLSIALLPPPDETSVEKQARILQEKQAKQRSDEIDKFLRADHASSSSFLPANVAGSGSDGGSKKGRVYKMVLLGQAGAGKTTVLKQMRLLYDPQAHERERKGWIKIVLLNLTASARVLLQTLARYHEERLERKSSELSRLEGEARAAAAVGSNADAEAKHEQVAVVLEEKEDMGPKNEINTSNMHWMEHVAKVVDLEKRLRNELGAFGEEAVLDSDARKAATTLQNVPAKASGGDKSPLLLRPGWQERLFTYARRSFSLSPTAARSSSTTHPVRTDPDQAGDSDTENENQETLELLRSIQGDLLQLWNDDARTRSLRKRGLFLDGQSDAATSYFLDNYTRITHPDFTPSDEDILHSRVRTLGVTEDVFRVDRSLVYRIYDVGGSRSQRAAWAPFLDDVESIIFLAPLSAFDQPLVEDPNTNRLADTFALFNQIVGNPLLKNSSMILFLNKIDLLEKKLRQGVKLNRYWSEYDGDNDFEAVWRWFRGKFRDCCRMADEELALASGHQQHQQQFGHGGSVVIKRRLYVHTTVATSTKQIRAILMSVKDSILRENLKVTGLVI